MRIFFFSFFSTILILGSWTFSNAQNCAIPNYVSFPEDDEIRVETANTSVILGSIETLNVVTIKTLENDWDDFINFTLESKGKNQIIKLNLKSLLKNEVDDKKRQSIVCRAALTCADRKEKIVTFSVGIKDQNTKCPIFEHEEYQLTLNLDDVQEGKLLMNQNIYVTDGDRDFSNANFTVIVRDELASVLNIRVDLNPTSPKLSDGETRKGIPDDHKFEVSLTLRENPGLQIGRGIQRLQLTAENVHNMIDKSSCSSVQSSAFVVINFTSSATAPTTEYPVITPIPHYAGPPEFNNFYYYFIIKDLSEMRKGKRLEHIKPSKIEAKDPDLLHTVKYSIVPGNTSGLLSIDPTNGVITCKEDLTEDYIEKLKDKIEIYKIQAFIAETWIKPTMQFSYAPLILVYDINHEGNQTEDTTTPSYGSEIPTKPTDSGEISLEPSEATSTSIMTTTIESEHGSTTEDETVEPDPTEDYGTSQPELPHTTEDYGTSQPELPHPTEDYGTSQPELPHTTEDYGTNQPELPHTTEDYGTNQPELPHPTEDYGTSQPELPHTTEDYGTNQPELPHTTEDYGTNQPELPHTTEDYGTNQPELPHPTEEYETDQPEFPLPTTGYTWYTTDTEVTDLYQSTTEHEIETTMLTTTTLAPTTNPPIVCPNCTIVEDHFNCEEPGIFRDVNLCNIFHQCVQKNNSTELLHYTNRCPPYTGFNKVLNKCEYPPKCECLPPSAFKREGKSNANCPPCQSECVRCRKVLPGESVCDGSSMLYPDPFQCEVFHSCRTDDQGGYIDCIFDCPDNLVFDAVAKVCVRRTTSNCPYYIYRNPFQRMIMN